MSEKYAAVKVRIHKVNPKSIIVDSPRHQETKVIARSLIHGIDDLNIEKIKNGVPVTTTIRVFEWKATEYGLK